MTQENPQAAPPAADPNAPVVTPQAVYIKDCSFEAPSGPFVQQQGQANPSVNLNLATRANALGQDLHERHLDVFKQIAKTCRGHLRGEGVVQLERDVGIFRRVWNRLLQRDLVERDLALALADEIGQGNADVVEDRQGEDVHLVA